MTTVAEFLRRYPSPADYYLKDLLKQRKNAVSAICKVAVVNLTDRRVLNDIPSETIRTRFVNDGFGPQLFATVRLDPDPSIVSQIKDLEQKIDRYLSHIRTIHHNVVLSQFVRMNIGKNDRLSRRHYTDTCVADLVEELYVDILGEPSGYDHLNGNRLMASRLSAFHKWVRKTKKHRAF